MGKSLRLGIVGFGRIVELTHLPLINRIGNIEVYIVYDVTPERRNLAKRRGYRTSNSLTELLGSPIDALLIATPPGSHYDIAADAIEHGKHVLIEKPVTVTSEQALLLHSMAQKKQVTVSVFQNRRYDKSFQLVKEIVESGRLGNIQFVERRQDMFGSGSTFGVKSFNPEWRNQVQYGGGALLDWGVHLIDQVMQLNLGEVMDVRAVLRKLRWNKGEVDDYIQANIILDNDIVVSLSVNFASNASMPLWVIGGDQCTLQILNEKEALLLERGKDSELIPISPQSKYTGEDIYRTFAGHILYGQELAVSLDEAILTMKVIDAIRLSDEKGGAYGNSFFSTAARI